jgi:hypothetical protein
MTSARYLPAVLLGLALAAPGFAQHHTHISELAEHETQYYKLRTNLPRETAQRYARQMDLIFEEFNRLLGQFTTRRQYRKKSVFLLADHEDYVGLMDSFGIEAEHSGGLYFEGESQRRSGLATYVGDRSFGSVMRTLRHEAFHQFQDYRLNDRLPVWLNEGFAEYFERAVVTEAGRVSLGRAALPSVLHVRQMVRDDAYIRFDRFFDISSKAWRRNMRRDMGEGTKNQYVQAWSLVYFFMHGDDGRYSGAFEQFVSDLAGGRAQRQAFEEAFGIELANIEPAWREFAANLTPDNVMIARAHLDRIGQYMLRRFEQADEPIDAAQWEKLIAPEAAPESPLVQADRALRGGAGQGSAAEGDWTSSGRYRTEAGQWASFKTEPAGSEGDAEASQDLPPRVVADGVFPRVVLDWKQQGEDRIRYRVIFTHSLE